MRPFRHDILRSTAVGSCCQFFSVAVQFVPAQTASGSIIGTVTDSTGAVVAGAVVEVKSVSTGAVQTRTTTASGTYSVIALEPGDYSLSVSSSGFRPVQSTAHVLVGQTLNGNFVLRPQQAKTEVTGGGYRLTGEYGSGQRSGCNHVDRD